MDEFHFELAARVEQAQRERGIDLARAKAQHARPADFDGSCTLCSEPVKPGRIDAGFFVCLDCAEAAELEEKMDRLG